MDDVFLRQHPPHIRVRVERTIKYVSRQVFDEYKAMGGHSMEELGIDPDTPLAKAHVELVQQWAAGPDRILGYIAQWGFMDSETAVIHHIKVYVDSELAWEGDLV